MSGRLPGAEIERRAHLLITDLGRVDDAIALLSAGLATDPTSRQWCLLALAHHRKGDPRQALSAAEHAISLSPEDEWGHRVRGLALIQLGRLDGGLASLQYATRLAPENPYAWADLAEHAAAGRQLDVARSASDRARSLAPEDLRCLLVTAYVASIEGDWLTRESAAHAALAVSPSSPGALDHLARCYERRGETEMVITLLRRALRADPTNRVRAINLTDVLAYEKHHRDEAASIYREMLETAPEDSRAWCGLAQVLEASHEFDEAVVAATRALEYDPANEWAYRLRGLALWGAGEHHRAIEDIRAATRLVTGDTVLPARPWHSLAELTTRLGLFDEAEMALSRAAEYAPGSYQQRVLTLLLAVARAQPQRAEREALAVEADDPGSFNAREARGHAAVASGDWASAESAFGDALRLEPESCCARAGVLLARLKQNEPVDAAAEMAAIADEAPNCGCTVVSMLGEHLAKKGSQHRLE